MARSGGHVQVRIVHVALRLPGSGVNTLALGGSPLPAADDDAAFLVLRRARLGEPVVGHADARFQTLAPVDQQLLQVDTLRLVGRVCAEIDLVFRVRLYILHRMHQLDVS